MSGTSPLLSPVVQQLYATLPDAPSSPPTWSLPEFRKGWAHLDVEKVNVPDGFKVEETVAKASGLKVKCYTIQPQGTGPYPTVLYFHGGGFVGQWKQLHLQMAVDYSAACQAVVIAVDYRLAPEHPFPAQIEDAWAVFQWVQEPAVAGKLHADTGRIACAGESAGGTLSVATALKARQAGQGSKIQGLVLISPWMAITPHPDTQSMREFRQDKMTGALMVTWLVEQYAGPGQDFSDPLFDPRQADLAGLPPALMITSEVDTLRDDGETFAAKLEAAGVQVQLQRWKGAAHHTFLSSQLCPEEAKAAYGIIDKFLKGVWQAKAVSA